MLQETSKPTIDLALKDAKKFKVENNVSYWDSPEAKILFQPKQNEDVLGCLRQIF